MSGSASGNPGCAPANHLTLGNFAPAIASHLQFEGQSKWVLECQARVEGDEDTPNFISGA